MPQPASDFDESVLDVVVELMDQESVALGEVFRDGVREVLSQPEFARSERMLDLIDVLEQRTLVYGHPDPPAGRRRHQRRHRLREQPRSDA